jgi:hypothetical protein
MTGSPSFADDPRNGVAAVADWEAMPAAVSRIGGAFRFRFGLPMPKTPVLIAPNLPDEELQRLERSRSP